MKIRYNILLIAGFLFSLDTLAQDAASFSCAAAAQKWKANVEFSEISNPTIYFSSGQRQYTCRFRFESFVISPTAEVPNLQAVMIPTTCDLDPELKKEMLNEFYLKVTKNSGKYFGQLQWLRHSQPGVCNIGRLSSEGMERLHTRWKEGNLN